jgi:hypothetical protein
MISSSVVVAIAFTRTSTARLRGCAVTLEPTEMMRMITESNFRSGVFMIGFRRRNWHSSRGCAPDCTALGRFVVNVFRPETKRDGHRCPSLNVRNQWRGLAHRCNGGDFSVFTLLRSVRFELELICFEPIVFALNASSFFGGRFLLNHLATAFEHAALFNHQ